jgi:UDP-N-acetyl-D-glucosamine dehydrogenase
LGHSFRFVELANDVNDHMPDYVVRRLMVGLNRQQKALNGSRVLMLGLAYKANTSDARESPSVVVAERLLAMGAEVRAADPHVVEGHVDTRITRVEATAAEVAAADAVLLLTDHDVFDLDAIASNARYLLDTRRRTTGPHVEYL